MSNVPTLIMWGDQDHIIPVDHAHATHRAVPASRLEIIEGSGHFPHVEMPDRFAEVLTVAKPAVSLPIEFDVRERIHELVAKSG